eukprot:SAG31_NODE_21_length_34109_cov_60.598824_31_plen_222_part_00
MTHDAPGHCEITRLLIEHDADVRRTNSSFRLAECHGRRESRSRTPIFHACCIGNVDAVILQLYCFSVLRPFCSVPLYPHPPSAQQILFRQVGLLAAKSFSSLNRPNEHDGVTPFWAACCMGHVSICRLLLALGANTSPTPHRSTHARHVGASPFWVACERGAIDVVRCDRLPPNTLTDGITKSYVGRLLVSLEEHELIEHSDTEEDLHPRGSAEAAAREAG